MRIGWTISLNQGHIRPASSIPLTLLLDVWSKNWKLMLVHLWGASSPVPRKVTSLEDVPSGSPQTMAKSCEISEDVQYVKFGLRYIMD